MTQLSISINRICCLRTSVEWGKDDVYLAGLLLPVKWNGRQITHGKITSFVTEHVSMKRQRELEYNELKDWDKVIELPEWQDDYILVLQIIEKNDGVLQTKFRSGEIVNAIEKDNIFSSVLKKVYNENVNTEDIDELFKLIQKTFVKTMSGIIIDQVGGDVTQKVKMDDVIASKVFTRRKVESLSSNKCFVFSNMFAKFKLNITINQTVVEECVV